VISYSTILPFLRCLPFASRYTDMAKVSHVRHLTIRASPAIPGLENKRLASAADSNTNRSNLHTIHASLPDVLRQFPELLTFTLKDTLVLYQADASILFNALKLIRPKKARLEIRMWDLYDCPVGQDLLAATRPSIHTSMSRTIISPPPSANREIRPFRDAGRSLMQEAWRDALYKGVELEFPQWWIEPPRADPPAPPANAAVGAHPFQQMHAAAMALLNAAPGNAPIDMSTFFSRHPSSSQTGLPGPAGGKTVSSTFNPYGHPPFQRRSTRPSSLPPGQASTTLDALTTRFVDDLSDVSSKADEDCARLLEATADQSGAFPDTLDLSTSSHATVSAPAPHTNTASPSGSMPLSAEMPLVSAEMPPVSAEMPPSGSSSVSTLAEPSSSQIVTGRSGQPCVNHVAMVIISADSPSSIAETVDMTEAQRARTDHLYVRPTTLSSNHSIDGHQRIPEIHSTVPPPRASTPSYLLRLRPDSRPSSRIRATRSSENRVVPAPDASAPGMTSYLLAHHTRGLLLELLEHHWTPYLQALSIVAFDPLVSLVVRAPLLDLWTQVAVPHIRVHLPRGCHSLSIFKGAKEVARDRMRNRQGDGAADPIPPDVNAENDQEADRVVGGDGMGGDLVHEDTRLFEIEVNTMAEMNDDVWIRGGNQLPPQVCRIFVGEQDWRDLRIGTFLPHSCRNKAEGMVRPYRVVA